MFSNEEWFEVQEHYPAKLSKIDVVSLKNGDCNVIFTFLVWNGYNFKEFTHTCKEIYSEQGQYWFRRFCAFMLGFMEEHDSWYEIVYKADMNDWMGYDMVVTVIDTDNPVIDDVIESFVTYDYLEEEEQKEMDERFSFDYETIFKDIKIKRGSVPEEINEHMRAVLNKHHLENKDEIIIDCSDLEMLCMD